MTVLEPGGDPDSLIRRKKACFDHDSSRALAFFGRRSSPAREGARRTPRTYREAIRAPGETVLIEVHAEGAQIYECKADAKGALVWVFREPIASLFHDGKTVGRHYAGPRWEFLDGGSVLARSRPNRPATARRTYRGSNSRPQAKAAKGRCPGSRRFSASTRVAAAPRRKLRNGGSVSERALLG